MSVSIDIAVESDAWNRLLGAELIAHRAAAAAFESAGVTEGEASILLADDERIRELNRQFRGKDQPTNVLSFPSKESNNEGARFFGDVAIAHETLMREAAAEGKRPDGHLSHLVAHGILHLLGFDHENERDAEKMESLETKILKNLGFPDPYAARAEETA